MNSPFGLPFISPSGLPIKAQEGQAVCVSGRAPMAVDVHWGSASDVRGAMPLTAEARVAWKVLDRKIDALLSKLRPARGHTMSIDDKTPVVESCWDRANEVGAFPTARGDDDDSQNVAIHPSDDTNEILVTDEEDPE